MTTPFLILLMLILPIAIASVFSRGSNKTLDLNMLASAGLGIAFLFFSIGHFAKTDEMVDMLPPWIPLPYALVYTTGILELMLGLALFSPKYRVKAAKLAIFIFVIFFPVNVYAAIKGVGMGGHQWGPVYLFIRAPLQVLLISWTYFLCVKHRG